MDNRKNIKVSQEFKDKLDRLGRKGETYEDIIVSLIEASQLDIPQVEATDTGNAEAGPNVTNQKEVQ